VSDTAEDRMTRALWIAIIGFLAAIVFLVVAAVAAFAHDAEHSEFDGWYAGLMQPDNPNLSCCGKADAYWCDGINVEAGKTFCTITDDRPDAPLNRPHIPVGTKIEIPDHKLKWDRGNPTGHAVVFVTRSLYVYCFVQSTGI
jgi:hypothetical protein